MPGGMLPDTIVQVSTPPPLFIKNSSAFCPTVRAGSTHTPFTIVPPLVLGEHSCVSPCTASAGPAAANTASNVPATATAAIALLIAPLLLLPLARHLGPVLGWLRRERPAAASDDTHPLLARPRTAFGSTRADSGPAGQRGEA